MPILSTRVINLFDGARTEIVIWSNHRSWIYPILVSLGEARTRGIAVTVLYGGSEDEVINSRRLRRLQDLGCCVVACDLESLVGEGLMVDPDTMNPEERMACEIFANKPVIAPVKKLVDVNRILATIRAMLPDSRFSNFRPQLMKVDVGTMIEAIRAVPAYGDCECSWEQVTIMHSRPIVRIVGDFRLQQVALLYRCFRSFGVEPFRAAGFSLSGGGLHPIIPPVLEMHSRRACIIEGHTRLYFLHREGFRRTHSIMLRGVKQPLASLPKRWHEVFVAGESRRREVIGQEHSLSNARNIESYARIAFEKKK